MSRAEPLHQSRHRLRGLASENRPNHAQREGQFAFSTDAVRLQFSIPEPLTRRPGKYPAFSYFSVRFRHWGEAVLRAFLEELAQIPEGKALAGLYLNGGADGQWFDSFDQRAEPGLSADYADCAQDYYRDYLKRKYGTPEKLGAAWGRSEPVAFESVKIPGRSEFWTTKHAIEPRRINQKAIAGRRLRRRWPELNCFRSVVKAVSGRRLLAGVTATTAA